MKCAHCGSDQGVSEYSVFCGRKTGTLKDEGTPAPKVRFFCEIAEERRVPLCYGCVIARQRDSQLKLLAGVLLLGLAIAAVGFIGDDGSRLSLWLKIGGGAIALLSLTVVPGIITRSRIVATHDVNAGLRLIAESRENGERSAKGNTTPGATALLDEMQTAGCKLAINLVKPQCPQFDEFFSPAQVYSLSSARGGAYVFSFAKGAAKSKDA